MNRKTRITIETHSITIIRTSGNRFSAYCEHCRRTVSAFPPEKIAAVMQLDPAEVCRRIETRQVHLTNDGENAALICGESLKATGSFEK